MSDTPTNPTPEESQAKKAETGELTEELNRLVESFSRAMQAAWRSDQRKQLQTTLNEGLTSLVNNVERVITDFSESEQGQEVREQAERVVERVRSSKVAADIQDGLTQGLRTVAEEVREFAQRMESQSAPKTDDTAQDIPVARADGEDNKPGTPPQV